MLKVFHRYHNGFQAGSTHWGTDSAWHSLNQIQAQTALWGGGGRDRSQQCVLVHRQAMLYAPVAAVLVLGSVEPWGHGAAHVDTQAISSTGHSHPPTALLTCSPTGDISPSALLVWHLHRASSSCQQAPRPMGTMPQHSGRGRDPHNVSKLHSAAPTAAAPHSTDNSTLF